MGQPLLQEFSLGSLRTRSLVMFTSCEFMEVCSDALMNNGGGGSDDPESGCR